MRLKIENQEKKKAQDRAEQRIDQIKNTPNYGFYKQKVNPGLMSTKEDYQMYRALGLYK